MGVIYLVELTNELNDSLPSAFHQVLERELVIDVDDHGFSIVLIGHTLDVHADLMQGLVVASRMEEKTGLVAFGQGVKESTAFVLPD